MTTPSSEQNEEDDMLDEIILSERSNHSTSCEVLNDPPQPSEPEEKFPDINITELLEKLHATPQETPKESSKEPAQESAKESVQESDNEVAEELTEGPAQEITEEPAQERPKELDKDDLEEGETVKLENMHHQDISVKLHLKEKLYILAESKKTSIQAAAARFNISPTTIFDWTLKHDKHGVRGIAPTIINGALIEQMKRHIHKQLKEGVPRLEVMKTWGVNLSFINKIIAKYGKVCERKGKNPIRGVKNISSKNYPSVEMRKEIVGFAEEHGMSAALIKYSINGRQFQHYYKRYGSKMEKGKRVVTKDEVTEMAKFSNEKGADVVVDKYCICRDQLYTYFKQYGYSYLNRKWKKAHKTTENTTNKAIKIESEKRKEPEKVNNYVNKDPNSRILSPFMKGGCELANITPQRPAYYPYFPYMPNGMENNIRYGYNDFNSNVQNENNKYNQIEKMREIVSFARKYGEKKAMKKYSIYYVN